MKIHALILNKTTPEIYNVNSHIFLDTPPHFGPKIKQAICLTEITKHRFPGVCLMAL